MQNQRTIQTRVHTFQCDSCGTVTEDNEKETQLVGKCREAGWLLGTFQLYFLDGRKKTCSLHVCPGCCKKLAIGQLSIAGEPFESEEEDCEEECHMPF